MGSLLLILVAVALLVLGLANGSSGLLISSIGASLLAAVALVVGARQAAAMRLEVDATPQESFSPGTTGRGQPRPRAFAAVTPSAPTASTPGAAADRSSGADWPSGQEAFAEEDPIIDRDPLGDVGDSGSTVRPDHAADSDPFPHLDRTSDSNEFSGSEPSRRPDPFVGPAPVRRSDRDVHSNPFTRPDPFVDSDPPARGSVPSQGGFPDEETGWRQPAEPYRRGARGAEPAGQADDEAGDEFAVVDIPPDEPDAQQVPPATAARVATLTADVMVIDGRPRYHLVSCPHLVGRESEPLPVREAVELGFTPCGRCEPDTRLIADAGQL